MTAFKGLGTYGNAVGVVTPLDHKLAQAANVTKTTTPLAIRPGVFYAGNASLVSGTAGMAYSVAAYEICTQRSAGAGVVFGGNDGALSVATTAAPGSNSRIDIIYHWHREYSLDGVDSNPVIGVVQGTAAASPTAPSLAAFPGAVELARVVVPAGVVATNSGTTITQTAPFTSADGGPVTFRTTTERDAVTNLITGTRGRTLSDSRMATWNAAWLPDPIINASTAALSGTNYVTTGAIITKVASIVATPNASSILTTAWEGGAFPNGLISVVAMSGDAATTGKMVINSGSTTANLIVQILNSAGAGVGAVGQRVNYIAYGW